MKQKIILFIFIAFSLSVMTTVQASERKKYNFNSEWRLHVGDNEQASKTEFDDSNWKQVTLPHAFNEDEAFKLHIAQLTDTVVWYRKHFQVKDIKDKKVFIEFEGIRQGGSFYLNGEYLGIHENGVMAVGFSVSI